MASPAADRLSAAHRRELSAIGAAVTSGVFSLALGADPFAIDLWFTSALDGLITKVVSGHAQARRSTVGYLTQHAALSGHSVRPVPASIDMGQVRTSLRVTGPVAFKTAIGNGATNNAAVESMARQLSGSSSRLALGGDRDTFDATLRSPRGGIVGYRRRLGGRGCGFCSMLASRGAVYHSEASAARTRDGQRYHDHCRCSPEPLYVHEQEPPEVRELQRQWQRVTAGHSGNGAVRAWERHWEGKLPPGQIRASADLTRSSLGLAAKEAVPGEGLAPAFHVELRPALAKARTTRKVEQVFLAEARRLTGRDIPAKFHHHDVDIAADHAEGILRVLAEFPDVEIASIRPAMHANHPNAYAVALTGSRELLLNPRYATDSVGYRESLRRAGGARFHLRGETTPVGTGAHEMAHLVHHQYDPVELRRTVSRLIEDQADVAGMDIVSYVKQEIGDYAVKHIDEMIAAAVADALTSGAAASRLSQGVLRLMKDQYARGRALTAPAVVRASEALDYSKLTVPQLKDIAAARGITVPARARKADVVALLDSGPTLEGFVPAALSITDRAILTQARADLRRLEADRAAPDRLAAMERAQRRIEGAETRILAAKRRPIDPAAEAEWSTARARAADDVGKALSELDEMVHAAASARAIETRLTTLGYGLHPDVLDDLLRAGRLGDRDAVNAAIDVIAERHGLVRITGRSGDVEPFDPAKHEMAGRGVQPPVGSPVRVFRPAWAMKDSDRQLSRASVSVADDVPSVRPTPDLVVGDKALDQVPITYSTKIEDGRMVTSVQGGRMTAAQREELRIGFQSYASGSFDAATKTMRGLSTPDGETAVFVERLTRAFDHAMDRSTLRADVELWRGLREGRGIFGDALSGDLSGFEWSDASFVSTMTRADEVYRFSRLPGGADSVVLRIVTPKGTRALALDAEHEVLLDRGLRYRVVADRGMVDGSRRLDVEVVPPTATPAVTSTKAAVARQAAIDKARAVGNLGADVLEQIENGMTGAALRTRITQTAARLGSPDKVRDALLAAVDDPAALRQAVAAQLRGAKLDTIGDAGALLRFDRKTMQAIDGTIADAAHVQVVRPGLSFRRGTETIQLSKATVEPLTAVEVREIERRAVRAAARERNRLIESRAGTARLLAEVDELIAKGAETRIIRQRLDPALIGPEQPFANADPAILEALRKALTTGPAALRSAVTRATTKAGLKPVSKAGAKVKFDPDLMESVSGVDIPAGAQVTVVTRGASVTLPDGTVLQLSKARVTAVAKPRASGPTPQQVEAKAKRAALLRNGTRGREIRTLNSGSVGDLRHMESPTGEQFVIKRHGVRYQQTAEEIKVHDDAEVLGPQVLDAVGGRSAATAQRGRDIFVEYIDGDDGEYLFAVNRPRLTAATESREGRLTAIADYLMVNNDRHYGNLVITTDGRLVGIDHGMAFNQFTDIDATFSDLAKFMLDPNKDYRLATRVPISPSDLVTIRVRLAKLEPTFARLGRQDWFALMMRRLAELERRATPGTPTLLP